MKLLTRMNGLPVIDRVSGRRIGRVERAHLHAGGWCLCGVSIKAEGFRARRLYTPLEDIWLIGEVAVIVSAAGKPPALKGEGPTPGLRVWSAQGEKLGWLSNALIDENDGTVHALEVSRGYIDDITSGRIWVREFTIRPCGVIAVLRAPG